MTILSVLFAILIFSFLIFIHELGHFAAAKLSGVQVNEFALFMGPAIFKKQKGETLYSLRTIPIGGYCAMEGEDEDTENPRSFQKAAWWKRLIILLAGAFMNFVAGLFLLLIVYLPAEQFTVPVIDYVEPGCTIVSEDGLRQGDRILEIDGEKIYISSDFTLLLTLKSAETHDIVVERNGQIITIEDLKMEKHEFPNEDGSTSLRYGFNFGAEDADFGNTLEYVWNTSLYIIRSVRLSLQMLLTGRMGLQDMSGPVGIVQVMTNTATASENFITAILNMLYFGGFIAINLAVMNLLPIPALDGGRAVALLVTTGIQKLTGKKINPKYEGYIHGAFMVLLLGLMAVILLKDVIYLFK